MTWIGTTAAQALVAEARRYLAVREQPAGSNRGREIDYWIHECGLDPAGAFPWCLAFVQQMGRQAVGQLWPCGRSAKVQDVAVWASAAGILHTQDRNPVDAQAGDLVLLFFPSRAAYAHIGIVEAGGPGLLTTIEGNTIAMADKGDAEKAREGYGVFRHTDRRTGPHVALVRWIDAVTW